jgi:predicted transcriptional regulator
METILEMTRDLITAQIRQRAITAETLDLWLGRTHGTLLELWEMEHTPGGEPMGIPIDWRSSITNRSITCLECSKVLRQLTRLHLRRHGLDAASYRIRFGIPAHVPLAARQVTARRQQIMRQFEVWKKAPHYGRGK